jgi:ankyrin repeat protein
MFLVNKGANLEPRDHVGNTPLHHASLRGNLEIFDFLRKRGSDLQSTNEDGISPLEYAFAFGNLAMAEFILQENLTGIDHIGNKSSSLLHFAAQGPIS